MEVPADDHGQKQSPAPAAEAKPSHGLMDGDDDPICKQPIEELYDLGKEIGRGGFSIVVEGVAKKDGKKFAIKCIKKSMVEGDDIKLLKREIKIMKKLDHSHILKLYDVFEDEAEFYLVMELYVYLLQCIFTLHDFLVIYSFFL